MKHFALKQCKNCQESYVPTGPAQRYCENCDARIDARNQRAGVDRYQERKGVRVGAGRGNCQWREENSAWMGGIGIYRQIKLANDARRICERCGKDLQMYVNRREFFAHWCVHHRNEDRYDNRLENLELLCKSCHQTIHNVAKNFLSKV